MNGLSLERTSFSRVLDMVDKLDMGRKLSRSDTSIPGYFKEWCDLCSFHDKWKFPGSKRWISKRGKYIWKFTYTWLDDRSRNYIKRWCFICHGANDFINLLRCSRSCNTVTKVAKEDKTPLRWWHPASRPAQVKSSTKPSASSFMPFFHWSASFTIALG